MFTGPVWGAWLGLVLMIVGLVATLPVEGGRFTLRLLTTAVASGVYVYLQSIGPFPYSMYCYGVLLGIVAVNGFFSIRKERGYGLAATIGEILLGVGGLLVLRSLFAAMGTVLVLVIVHLIRNR